MNSDEEKKQSIGFLMDVRSHPLYPGLLNYLNSFRPEVPPYQWNPDGDNIAEIKVRSLEQQGFDKIFNILKPK